MVDVEAHDALVRVGQEPVERVQVEVPREYVHSPELEVGRLPESAEWAVAEPAARQAQVAQGGERAQRERGRLDVAVQVVATKVYQSDPVVGTAKRAQERA